MVMFCQVKPCQCLWMEGGMRCWPDMTCPFHTWIKATLMACWARRTHGTALWSSRPSKLKRSINLNILTILNISINISIDLNTSINININTTKNE